MKQNMQKIASSQSTLQIILVTYVLTNWLIASLRHFGEQQHRLILQFASEVSFHFGAVEIVSVQV